MGSREKSVKESVQAQGQGASGAFASRMILESLFPGSQAMGGFTVTKPQDPMGLLVPSLMPVGEMPVRGGDTKGPIRPQDFTGNQVLDPNEYNLDVPEGTRPLGPGETPNDYYASSITPGGNTQPVVPPGYVMHKSGLVVQRPGGGTGGDPRGPGYSAQYGDTSNFAGTKFKQDGVMENEIIRPDPNKQGYGTAQGFDLMAEYLRRGNPYGSSLPGAGIEQGVRTNTMEEALEVQQGSDEDKLRTLLPSFDDALYKGFFEKYDAGELTGSTEALASRVMDIVANPVAANQEQMESVFRISGADQVAALPESQALGPILTQIYDSVPAPLAAFANDIFNSGDATLMEAELDNLSQSILDQGLLYSKEMTEQVLGQFAEAGTASSGSALKAITEGLKEITTGLNATIAQARVQGLNSLLQARELGVNLFNRFLSAGEEQQALEVSKQLKLLEVDSALTIAKLSAALQNQQTLNQTRDRTFFTMIDENRQVEGAQERVIQFIYSMLTQMATGIQTSFGTDSSRSSGFTVQNPVSISKDFTN